MNKLYATFEYLPGRALCEGVLTLTNSGTGEWAGSSLIQAHTWRDLYEIGYTHADLNAKAKSGLLDRYSRAACEGAERFAIGIT